MSDPHRMDVGISAISSHEIPMPFEKCPIPMTEALEQFYGCDGEFNG